MPGIVMGGLSGRLFGELLREAGIYPGLTPGAFALLGAGAVLTGMSRMTITLVAILTEARMQCTCKWRILDAIYNHTTTSRSPHSDHVLIIPYHRHTRVRSPLPQYSLSIL